VINVPAHVRYEADGFSHFDLLRDGLRRLRTNPRFVRSMLSRLPGLLARRFGAGA